MKINEHKIRGQYIECNDTTELFDNFDKDKCMDLILKRQSDMFKLMYNKYRPYFYIKLNINDIDITKNINDFNYPLLFSKDSKKVKEFDNCVNNSNNMISMEECVNKYIYDNKLNNKYVNVYFKMYDYLYKKEEC